MNLMEKEEEKKPKTVRLPISIIERMEVARKAQGMTVEGFIKLAILEKLGRLDSKIPVDKSPLSD